MTGALYRRPSLLRGRIVDPLIKTLVLRVGLGGRASGADPLRVLRMRGRSSGQLRDVPIRVAVIGGQRYLVSMLGEAQWVRNLRACHDAQLVVGNDVEPVTALEIHGPEKAAFLAQYLVHPAFKTSARSAMHVNTDRLTSGEVDRVAALHPVFRLSAS